VSAPLRLGSVQAFWETTFKSSSTYLSSRAGSILRVLFVSRARADQLADYRSHHNTLRGRNTASLAILRLSWSSRCSRPQRVDRIECSCDCSLGQAPRQRGHTLVVPHRHVESIFQLGGEEQTSVWNLVMQVRDRLRHRFDAPPDGFNVGPNDGVQAARQCCIATSTSSRPFPVPESIRILRRIGERRLQRLANSRHKLRVISMLGNSNAAEDSCGRSFLHSSIMRSPSGMEWLRR
jgi:hypothetical protein